MALPITLSFGPLLKILRKQAGMTQRDLAAALGYSESLISSLEKAQRQPDLKAVTDRFIAALGLQDDPQTAAALIEQAALARGERPPASITYQRTTQLSVQAELVEAEPIKTLPSLPTELIGRTAEINQLCNRLLGHSGRLLTLVGPPGVGKTRLGLEVATRLQLQYKDGAHFVPLAAVSDPELVAATIVNALELGDTGKQSPQTRLIQGLRHKELLLLLDNFEQIIAAAPLLATVLAECPGVHMLVTSRERLHLRAEQRYPVPPLDLDFAVALFVQQAQAVEPAFEPTSAILSIIAQICRRLDCLPLAIELIAARIDLFSPQSMLTRLQERRLDLLAHSARDVPEHQRSLRTAIQYSYDLCSSEEQRLFGTLGVFVGGFDLEAVVGLGYTEQTLQTLVNRSMVQVETQGQSERRGLLLETLREYAREQLVAKQELPTSQQRHADYFLSVAESYNCVETMEQHTSWIDNIERNLANIQAALLWVIEQKHTDKALRFINALHPDWFRSEFRLRTAHLYHAVIRLADAEWAIGPATLNGVIDPTLRQRVDLIAHGLLCAGQAAMSHPWDTHESTKLLERSAQLDRLTGVKQVTLLILLRFSRVERRNYNYERVVELCNRVLDLLPTVVDLTEWQRKRLKVSALRTLSACAMEFNDLTHFESYANQLLPLLEDLDDQEGIAGLCSYQGDSALFTGEIKQAVEFLNRSLMHMNRKDSWLEYKVKYQLGIVAFRSGELKKAQTNFVDYIKYHYSNFGAWHVSYGLWGLADLALIQCQSRVAAQLLGAADHLRHLTPDFFPKLYHSAYEATITAARAQLDETTYANTHAAGYAMTVDEAVAFALAQFAETEQIL